MRRTIRHDSRRLPVVRRLRLSPPWTPRAPAAAERFPTSLACANTAVIAAPSNSRCRPSRPPRSGTRNPIPPRRASISRLTPPTSRQRASTSPPRPIPIRWTRGIFEPLEDSIFRFEAEPVVEEISAAASPGSSSVESPAEAQVPVSSNGLLFGASPAAAVASAPERPVRSNRREIVFVTLAAAIGGVVTLGWLLARTAPRPEVTVAASTAGAPSTATRTAAPGSTVSVHRNNQWTAANSAVWAGDARNAIALELEAENSVGVWLRTVRPTLIVRCSCRRRRSVRLHRVRRTHRAENRGPHRAGQRRRCDPGD